MSTTLIHPTPVLAKDHDLIIWVPVWVRHLISFNCAIWRNALQLSTYACVKYKTAFGNACAMWMEPYLALVYPAHPYPNEARLTLHSSTHCWLTICHSPLTHLQFLFHIRARISFTMECEFRKPTLWLRTLWRLPFTLGEVLNTPCEALYELSPVSLSTLASYHSHFPPDTGLAIPRPCPASCHLSIPSSQNIIEPGLFLCLSCLCSNDLSSEKLLLNTL